MDINGPSYVHRGGLDVDTWYWWT